MMGGRYSVESSMVMMGGRYSVEPFYVDGNDGRAVQCRVVLRGW